MVPFKVQSARPDVAGPLGHAPQWLSNALQSEQCFHRCAPSNVIPYTLSRSACYPLCFAPPVIQSPVMPIAPENRWLYPIDWRELSRLIRFERAKGRCERCGRPHGRDVVHLGDGTWWDEEQGRWRDGCGRQVRGLPLPSLLEARQPSLDGIDPVALLPVTRVVLASCHLDHDPGHNRPRNLAALCQRCHMIHDREEHRRTRWRRAHQPRAAGDLFG